MKLDIENNIVAKILDECPASRNNREILYIQLCAKELIKQGFGLNDILFFRKMIKLVPRESTIIRQAAVIQNNMGLYPPTDKVRKGRKEKEIKCRYEYSKKEIEEYKKEFGPDYKEVKPNNWLKKILFTKIW